VDVGAFAALDWLWPLWGYAAGLGFLVGAAALIVRAIFREGR
jgi:hypothetical protein